ncbi:MAG: exoD [Chthoniobacteraceae bacterium]|nr:exoD [Chthoniobacteraceae bacterium]MDB6171099.1 exoD [Chthoniobacteraceae bacterium]
MNPPPVTAAPELEPSPPARRLSTDLQELLAEANGRSLTLGQLEAILQGRGFALFILLLSLPFLSPIAIPGLSVPFGVVIMFIGVRIVMGRKPALPRFILGRKVSYVILEKMVNIGLKLCKKMEKVVRPRMHFLQRSPGMINLIGAGIASGGLLLCLPLPPLIPLSNTIPAASILLLTAGMVERDGLMVLLGYITNIAAWIYFTVMFLMIGGGIKHLLHYFGL